MVATSWDSLGLQLDRIHAAVGAPQITLGVVNLVMLALPIGGTIVSLSRSGRMIGRGLRGWAADSDSAQAGGERGRGSNRRRDRLHVVAERRLRTDQARRTRHGR